MNKNENQAELDFEKSGSKGTNELSEGQAENPADADQEPTSNENSETLKTNQV